MQRLIPALALMLLAGGALAAPKPCEELKQEIEVKIQANNEVQDQSMVVGSCDGGTKKIVYQRNG